MSNKWATAILSVLEVPTWWVGVQIFSEPSSNTVLFKKDLVIRLKCCDKKQVNYHIFEYFEVIYMVCMHLDIPRFTNGPQWQYNCCIRRAWS